MKKMVLLQIILFIIFFLIILYFMLKGNVTMFPHTSVSVENTSVIENATI